MSEVQVTVVVRVRPRNQQEILENSSIAVSTQGSKEIIIKNDNQSKTYTFDKVFGPQVNQNVIWDHVVKQMLAEVLLGYNCTIFAYG
jgi:kinesin family protein 11